MGQRITTMTSGQARLPVAPSIFKFAQHGQSGAWISELLPNIASNVDDLAIVKTVNTEAINHDPAITYIQTGSQIPGRETARPEAFSPVIANHAGCVIRLVM